MSTRTYWTLAIALTIAGMSLNSAGVELSGQAQVVCFMWGILLGFIGLVWVFVLAVS